MAESPDSATATIHMLHASLVGGHMVPSQLLDRTTDQTPACRRQRSE